MLPLPPLLRLLVAAAVLLVAVHGADAQETGAIADGRDLAEALGCGACHAGAPAPSLARGRAPRLGPGGTPLPADFVFTWLGDPRRRRDDIGPTRMPDFGLDEGERVALALFLGTDPDAGASLAAARTRHPDADEALGARIYAVLGCAGCHEGVAGASAIQGPDLSREGARVRPEWLQAWLRAPSPLRGPAHPAAPGARMPDFRLTDAEAASLGAWLLAQGRAFASPPEAPLTPLQTRRIDGFLEDRVSCLGCHRVQGRGGRIGPALDGVALRLRPSFVLETILDPQGASPGSPMPHQPMPRREAERLARRLLDIGTVDAADGTHPSLADPAHPAWTALGPTVPAARPEPDTNAPSSPAALYARHCAACHGAEGRGDGWNASNLPFPPTPHADATLMSQRVDDALYDAISAGAWVLDGSARMPAFGGMLSHGEIRGLVEYVRTLCACEAPAWSRDGRRGGG